MQEDITLSHNETSRRQALGRTKDDPIQILQPALIQRRIEVDFADNQREKEILPHMCLKGKFIFDNAVDIATEENTNLCHQIHRIEFSSGLINHHFLSRKKFHGSYC